MNTKIRNKASGFTIIEVLIVLAIAGLILLVVFLAVPALQRNSRNTQRRNEVAAVLGAVNEYVANTNGTLPTAGGAFNTVFTGSNVSFRQYTAADVTYDRATATRTGTPVTNTDVTKVVVYNYAKCSGSAIDYGSGANSRSVAVLFAVENSGGTTQQCTES